MCKSNNVVHKLFTLVDGVSGTNSSSSHDDCEVQKKKLSTELARAQQQIQQLSDYRTNHICWNSAQPQPHFIEELKR